MHNGKPYDIIIIGGGFYGCYLALFLRETFERILIIEKESDLLTRASYVNQARVHNGYHYPRSILTAMRSRVNFPRFVMDFKEAVHDQFTKVYAIVRNHSKVNARQFAKFCHDIGADIDNADPAIQKLFNSQLVEQAFTVKEYAFDATIIRDMMKRKLEEAGVEILYNTEVERVEDTGDVITVHTTKDTFTATQVINCGYSQINTLLERSGLPRLPLRHEITEMALVDVPEHLQELGITLMDGPFFSVMPFPAEEAHTLSHVRYTPQFAWVDEQEYRNPHEHLKEQSLHTNFEYMIKDANRYMPSLEKSQYRKSLFEVKTVLLENEGDDGRPILFRQHYGMKNFSVVMGGKIDNIYDIVEAIKRS